MHLGSALLVISLFGRYGVITRQLVLEFIHAREQFIRALGFLISQLGSAL